MNTFYWLIEDALAGCSRPGGALPGPPTTCAVEQDVERLRAEGIGALLTLTENHLPEEAVRPLSVLHVPVQDMTAPLPEQFLQALDFIDRQRARGKRVAVHCLVGQGRTATVLAAYLIREGMTAEDAIGRLRELCPGAIGSESQEEALRAFARRRDWIL